MSHFKVVSRLVSVLIYEKDNDENYSSSCQIFCCGDKGIVFSIIGELFYKVALERIEDLFKELNINVLEGYMRKSHTRLIRMKLKDKIVYGTRGMGEMAGHQMIWVVIQLKTKSETVGNK